VEHGTFSPPAVSCTGGMSCAATATYKGLDALTTQRKDEPYSTTYNGLDQAPHLLLSPPSLYHVF
jgi:hypothetical protein